MRRSHVSGDTRRQYSIPSFLLRSRRNDYIAVTDNSNNVVSFNDDSWDGQAKYWALPKQFLGNKVFPTFVDFCDCIFRSKT